jgi:hypothetical protein
LSAAIKLEAGEPAHTTTLSPGQGSGEYAAVATTTTTTARKVNVSCPATATRQTSSTKSKRNKNHEGQHICDRGVPPNGWPAREDTETGKDDAPPSSLSSVHGSESTRSSAAAKQTHETAESQNAGGVATSTDAAKEVAEREVKALEQRHIILSQVSEQPPRSYLIY